MPPEQSGGAALSIINATKNYGGAVAVDDVSLDVAAGEFLTMLGSSGSGKTTTLNAIAGFVKLTSGSILLDGQEIERLPSYKRNIGVVFQHYALFPHMTVRKNIAFPLEQRKLPKGEAERLIDEALAMVRLEGYADRFPRQLSGGQQQRVALARALVFKPRLLLMDEPLGALDKKLREWLQLEIKRIHRELGVTFIYVTHDQEEALVLSDRIAVMSNGRIEQVGTAVDLYERPATQFVAEFIGESNVFRGTVSGAGSLVQDGNGTTALTATNTYTGGTTINAGTLQLGNGGGETPLIRAVQRRDLGLVRAVLAAGGNPDQTDNVAGMSARDYAKADPRAGAIAKLIDETPKKTVRPVAGPRL